MSIRCFHVLLVYPAKELYLPLYNNLLHQWTCSFISPYPHMARTVDPHKTFYSGFAQKSKQCTPFSTWNFYLAPQAIRVHEYQGCVYIWYACDLNRVRIAYFYVAITFNSIQLLWKSIVIMEVTHAFLAENSHLLQIHVYFQFSSFTLRFRYFGPMPISIHTISPLLWGIPFYINISSDMIWEFKDRPCPRNPIISITIPSQSPV